MVPGQRRGGGAAFLLFVVVLATGLTLFYFVHEKLPKGLRAPSSLLLAPVAIVDGLCYAAGISGIYGKLAPIFLVNTVFAAVLGGIGCWLRNLWRRREP